MKTETPKPPSIERSANGRQIVFSKKYFSISTDEGISGYPPGTRFELISNDTAKAHVKTADGIFLTVKMEMLEFDATQGIDAAKRETAAREQVLAARAAAAQAARERKPASAAISVASPKSPPAPVIRPASTSASLLSPPSPTPTGPKCTIRHYLGIYHRAVDGHYFPCPNGVQK